MVQVGSSQSGSWYAATAKPLCMLATGGMPVSVGCFGYRWDSCELEALDYRE
jgi:hypothetical protein